MYAMLNNFEFLVVLAHNKNFFLKHALFFGSILTFAYYLKYKLIYHA